MMSSPNMKDVHDSNMSFFSPQPFFIAGFFFPQQLFQLAWLYRLWKLAPQKSLAEKQEMDTLVDFVPYYAIGNACIGSELQPQTLSQSNPCLTILLPQSGCSSGTRQTSRLQISSSS